MQHRSAKIAPQQKLGTVVSITSRHGGLGKTTTAILLAAQIVQQSKEAYQQGTLNKPMKVVVVDADYQDGQIGLYTSTIRPTAYEIYNQRAGTDSSIVLKNLVYYPQGGFNLLLATQNHRKQYISPDFYKDVIPTLQQKFDIVILDTPSNWYDPMLNEVCYPLADKIIYLTNMWVGSNHALAYWNKEILAPKSENGLGISPDIVATVVTSHMNMVNMELEEIARASKPSPIIASIPSKPEEFTIALNTDRITKLLEHEDIRIPFAAIATHIIGF